MKRQEVWFHGLFFAVTLIWLGAYLLYQVFPDRRQIDLRRLFARAPVLAGPVITSDPAKISVVCDPVCYFIVDGRRVRSRTDSDAGGGLSQVKLRFYDPYHSLIGYEDDSLNPNFFVIDGRGEFLQAIRLKLPKISFTFEAYYPGEQLIQFRADSGRKYLYSANKPELLVL